jgi:hypothetical protein
MSPRIIQVHGRELEVHEDGRIYRVAFTGPTGRRSRRHELSQCDNGHGYLVVGIRTFDGKSRNIRVNRVVAQAFLPNYCQELQVHHIDGNRVNNHVSNLRMVTSQENHRSCRRKPVWAKSKYRGVSVGKKGKGWAPSVVRNGKQISLGLFTDEIEAAHVRDAAARAEGYDESALNFPIIDTRKAALKHTA